MQESISKELVEDTVVLDNGDADCVNDEDERTTDSVFEDLITVEDLVELDLTALLLATPHVPNPTLQPVPQ